MGLVRTAAPAAFLDLDEVKLHLRVDADNTAEDTLIQLYLDAAVDAIEGHLHRAILEQTWKLTLDEFPRGCYSRMAGWYSGYPHTWPASERGPSSSLAPDLRIRLPRPSLIDVVSVKYFDPSGTFVT